MRNKFSKKIKIICSALAVFAALASHADASSIMLAPSKENVGIQEQFYVDVMLDPEGLSVNGIEGNIAFPGDSVSFIRAEDGGSLVRLWVEDPRADNDTISLSGIIPNGFDGVIDPFNPKVKLPGLITRLVFEGKQEGVGAISASDFQVTLNDGQGTLSLIAPIFLQVGVKNINNPIAYADEGAIEAPILEASVVRDPDLFENKYTLAFLANDKGSGIKEVKVKEGNREWKTAESPYLLEDQGRHSIIKIQAINFKGASVMATIDPLPYRSLPVNIIFVLAFIILLLFLKRIYDKKKHQHA
jgi:hypothetical protein